MNKAKLYENGNHIATLNVGNNCPKIDESLIYLGNTYKVVDVIYDYDQRIIILDVYKVK